MKDIKNLTKNLLIFLSYFIFTYIPYIIIGLLGINDNFSKCICLIILNIIYIMFLTFIYKDDLKENFKKLNIKTIFKYTFIYIAGIILMIFSNKIISNITNLNVSNNEFYVRKLIKSMPIYMFITVVIFSPFIEEIIFRKSIRKILKNKYLFIIISGCIFGLIHANQNNLNINEFLMTIPYMIMGIDFAYIYYKTDNIFSTILFHSMHNLILFIIQILGG